MRARSSILRRALRMACAETSHLSATGARAAALLLPLAAACQEVVEGARARARRVQH